MDDREFQDLVDELFMVIEDQLDEVEADLDIQSSGGVLTIELPGGSSVILSRQVASHEVWVAARSGGFHLKLVDGRWVSTTTSEDLAAMLTRVFSEQLGEPLMLTL